MPVPEALAAGAPAGGGWLVASIAWPVIALLLVIAGGERFAARVGVRARPRNRLQAVLARRPVRRASDEALGRVHADRPLRGRRSES